MTASTIQPALSTACHRTRDLQNLLIRTPGSFSNTYRAHTRGDHNRTCAETHIHHHRRTIHARRIHHHRRTIHARRIEATTTTVHARRTTTSVATAYCVPRGSQVLPAGGYFPPEAGTSRRRHLEENTPLK